MSTRRRKGSLKGRLARLGIAKSEPAGPLIVPGPSDTRQRLRRLFPKDSGGAPTFAIPDSVMAAANESALDVKLRLCHELPAAAEHGDIRLDRIFEATVPGSAARLAEDPAFANFDPRRALFFDTETTGLAGGAGTLVFLVGWGFFEGDRFVVRQGLVQDFGHEAEVLEEFSRVASGFETLVSFNGRSFDIDRLKLRYAINRLAFEALEVPHLDLVYPARRLLGPALAGVGCTLKSLEAHYLGFRREGDIDGADAPRIFLEWLNARDDAPMARVVEHNRLDILSLVTLSTLLLERAAAPVELARGGSELFAAARFVLRRAQGADEVAATAAFESALDAPLSPPTRARVHRELSRLYKRAGRWDDAVSMWLGLAERGDDAWVVRELAKAFEHRLHDLQAAERWAEKLVEVTGGELRQRAVHRLKRIRRRRESRDKGRG